MNRYKTCRNLLSFEILSLAFIILLAGCASGPEVQPLSGGAKEPRLERALLVKEIKKGVNPAPIEEISVFSEKDQQAVMWLELKELEGRHILR